MFVASIRCNALFYKRFCNAACNGCRQSCAELVSLRRSKIGELTRQVIANDTGRLAGIHPLFPQRLVTNHRRAKPIGHRARRVRIAQQLAQHQLTRFDSPALPLARDAATTQRLIRRRGSLERLGDRDAARAMRRLYPVIESKSGRLCRSDKLPPVQWSVACHVRSSLLRIGQ